MGMLATHWLFHRLHDPDWKEFNSYTSKWTYEDYKKIFVHQVSIPFLKTFVKISGAPEEKIVITLPDHGNMAAASMPIGLDYSLTNGELKSGDKIMFIGLAGGISIGVMLMQL